MPRPKGPGALKFLDVKEQGDVDMRAILWRGEPPTPEEIKLNELRIARIRLTVRLTNLRTWQKRLHQIVNGELPIMARADAKTRLRDAEKEIAAVETQLRSNAKQIKETQKRMKRLPRSRREVAIFQWQERAVQLIAIHKYLDPDGDHVASTHGSTITTRELQRQLAADGFMVGTRELRRFMRQCGVEGQQGKRSDLTSDNSLR